MGGRGQGTEWGGRCKKSTKAAGKGGGREGRAEKAGKIKGGRAGGWEMNAKNGFVQTFGLQEED